MAKKQFNIDLDLDAGDIQKAVEDQYEEVDTTEEDTDEGAVEVDTEEDTEESKETSKRKQKKADSEEDTEEEVDESSEDEGEEENPPPVKKKDVKEEDSEDDLESQQNSPNDKPKKQSRYQERVRELVQAKKDAEARVERLAREKDAEIENLRKQNYESEKMQVVSAKQSLNQRLASLKSDFTVAGENNDFAKQHEINAEVAQIGAKLANVEELEKRYQGDYKPQARQSTYTGDMDREKAVRLASDFEFDNPRMLSDASYRNTATELGKQLMSRGFKVDSEDFYKELDSRLAKAYGYSSDSSKKVKQKVDEEDFEDEFEEDSKKKTQEQPKKKPAPQNVSGASRTPSPIGASAKGGKVTLSSEEQAVARSLGQTNKEYAANKLKMEQSTDAKGRIAVDLF